MLILGSVAMVGHAQEPELLPPMPGPPVVYAPPPMRVPTPAPVMYLPPRPRPMTVMTYEGRDWTMTNIYVSPATPHTVTLVTSGTKDGKLFIRHDTATVYGTSPRRPK